MTNKDVMIQILSDATGKSLEEVRARLQPVIRMMSGGELERELSDLEAEKLLKELREELPGIRMWLEQGRREMAQMIGAQARRN